MPNSNANSFDSQQPPTIPSTTSIQSGSGSTSLVQSKVGANGNGNDKLNISGGNPADLAAGKDGASGGRSPPPQRHVHTHHHTHVGLGYPMYPAPYGRKLMPFHFSFPLLSFQINSMDRFHWQRTY